jgi:hypothetical protein
LVQRPSSPVDFLGGTVKIIETGLATLNSGGASLKTMKNTLLVAILLVTALWCVPAVFAASVTVAPSGTNGVYVVSGSGFVGTGGAEITISYDTATLSSPTLSWGGLTSGTLTAPNTNIPGVIKLAFVSATGISGSGSGPIATITFRVTGRPGPVRVTYFKAIDTSGAAVPSQVEGGGGAESTTTTSTSGTSAGGGQPATPSSPSGGQTPSAGGATTPVWTGSTVTIPGETAPAPEKAKEVPPPPAPEPELQREKPVTAAAESESTRAKAETPPEKAPAEQKFVSLKSVLEQFRGYKGEKTPQKLVGLFAGGSAGIRQEPPVALSDGNSPVKLFIEATSSVKEAPNFALKGAQLESLKMEGDSVWVVEAVPNKGVYEATVTMLQGGSMTEIPLTVAPPLPADLKIGEGGKLAEADFVLFLKEAGSGKATRFDLNGDGKKDYIDDYIFTANYIVKGGGKGKGPGKEQK